MNTFKTLEKFATIMNENGTKPECEAYEICHINNVAYFMERGLLKKPGTNTVCPRSAGTGATPENLIFLVETVKKTLDDFNWSVAAAGKNQPPIAAIALAKEL